MLKRNLSQVGPTRVLVTRFGGCVNRLLDGTDLLVKLGVSLLGIGEIYWGILSSNLCRRLVLVFVSVHGHVLGRGRDGPQ